MARHIRSRGAVELARKKGSRAPYDRVLIVCEGKKTEPLYFNDIRQQFRISSAHVRVLHSDFGTEPRQIVDFAEHQLRSTRAFERVYAVFDRDQHRTYHDALQRAEALDGRMKNENGRWVSFKAVPSVPCFEMWLLLHYIDLHVFCDRQEALQRLKRYIPMYAKGSLGVYKETEQYLEVAFRRAEWLRGRFNCYSGTDAYTDVDTLVTVLRSLNSS